MKCLSKVSISAVVLCLSACSSLGSGTQLRRAMTGAWSTEQGDITLLIEGKRCVQAQDAAQMLFQVQFNETRALRTQSYLGQPVPGGMEMDGAELILVDPVAGQDHRFQRLASTPESVMIEPFALGTAATSAAERERVARNLAQREMHGRGLRRSIEDSLDTARLTGRLNSYGEQIEFMASPKMVNLRDQLVANDASNSVHIEALLRQRGWIGKAEYGEQAQLAAFNMVRFGGNLRTMRSVLPALKQELESDPSLGYLYTLLYDSTQLSLGEKQLYGTLLLPDMDGRMRLRRVAKKSSLDRRRKEMGLPPIREFLANFEQQFGTIRIED